MARRTSPFVAKSNTSHSNRRSSSRGKGCYRLAIHGDIRKKLKVNAGAFVEIAMERDVEPREPVLPPALVLALRNDPKAQAVFRRMTTALRRQIVALPHLGPPASHPGTPCGQIRPRPRATPRQITETKGPSKSIYQVRHKRRPHPALEMCAFH